MDKGKKGQRDKGTKIQRDKGTKGQHFNVSRKLIGQKQNHKTVWDKKITQPLGGKTQPLGTKKITQPLGSKKITQSLGTKKNATSQDKKKLFNLSRQ